MMEGQCLEVQDTSCCGLYELISVGDAVDNSTDKDFQQDLKKTLTRIRSRQRGGAVLATLTASQTRERKLLEKAGFKRVLTFHNPNSGNRVGVYLKTLSAKYAQNWTED